MKSKITLFSGETNRMSMFLSAVVLAFVIGALLALILPKNETLVKLQSGEYKLECMFEDGWREVPKEKIVDTDDEKGGWIFTNGYARTCKVIKTK
nr:MAG TPA: protein of unknown function (DUF883) [Bacteriophage sp.]